MGHQASPHAGELHHAERRLPANVPPFTVKAGQAAPRVIFVNRYFHPDLSATSQLLSDLAFHLANERRVVHVVTSRHSYADPSVFWPAEETTRGVFVHRVWTSAFGRARLWARSLDYVTFYCSAFVMLLRIVRRGDILVAKTDPPLVSVVACIVARLRGARLINWVQDLFPEVATALRVSGPGFLTALLRAWRNRSMQGAVANVVLGTRMKERLEQEGLQRSRIKVIHNWADGRAVYPVESERNPLRPAWGLDRKCVVGYSGNLGRAHEFRTLLDAAEALVDRDDIVFLFIGEGAQLPLIKQHAKEKALHNVVFKPYQPRELLGLSLSAADVHIVSLNPCLEGLIVPSKFYGVAAAGRPVIFIGSPTGEIPTLIEQAGCGWTVEPSDPTRLARIIRALGDDEAERRRLGRRARETFERHFDGALAFRAWESVLNEAA
ncbi:MAG TPA: glycosyltransferase family 4 protein [Nitrospira sp.]|nr:glycosyltransferase family 4 protein [Nitrospira sp.]